MALQSNKRNIIALLFAILMAFGGFAQPVTTEDKNSDYKDPKSHEKFRKRSNAVGAWQINKLKGGALVVRLKTNKMLIDELVKQGNTELAEQRRVEQFAINKNTMLAFLDHFNFCKVYFIYSNSSDSLLKGARGGIFLDTTLSVNPSITMPEDFYLLVERDYAYNSSIGFVEEDSARYYVEKGNPVKEMAFVVKNKYSHQLKGPFPYYVKEKSFMGASYPFPVKIVEDGQGGSTILYAVNKTYLQDLSASTDTRSKKGTFPPGYKSVEIPKHFTYEKLSEYVSELNGNLFQYHRDNASFDETRLNPEVKRFLY